MDNFRRFDEHLYRTPVGFFFVVRPLDPEEAEAWIIEHDDEPLARQLFLDDEDCPSPNRSTHLGRDTSSASLVVFRRRDRVWDGESPAAGQSDPVAH